MTVESGYRHRRLASLTLAAQALLYTQAACSLAAAATGHFQGHDLDGSGDSPLYSGLALLQVAIFVIGGIVVLTWLYRAVAKVHTLGARGFSTGPAMAIAWYFIPLANLGMPYATMRDVWKASVNPRDWEAAPAPARLGVWWLFWVVGNSAGIAAFRLALDARIECAEAFAAPLTTFSDLCTAAASLLLATIIGPIARMQTVPEAVRPAARVGGN